VDLLAGGGVVYLRVEKTPSICPMSKHRSTYKRRSSF